MISKEQYDKYNLNPDHQRWKINGNAVCYSCNKVMKSDESKFWIGQQNGSKFGTEHTHLYFHVDCFKNIAGTEYFVSKESK